MKLSTTFAALLFFALPHAAFAASPDSGEGLKQDIERALNWYIGVSERSRQGISQYGPVSVESKGDFFEARIPDVQILGGNGFILKVPQVLINARAGARQGEWVISAALPASMPIIDAAASVVADLKIGKQKFSAVWIPAQDVFTSHDAEYADVQVVPRTASPYQMTLKKLTSALKLSQDNDGTWSGPHALSVEKLEAKVEKFGSSLGIKAEKIETSGRYDRFPLAEAGDARNKARALLAARDAKADDVEIRRLTLEAARSLKIFPDGLEARMRFQDVAVHYDPGQSTNNPADRPLSFKVGDLSGAAKLTGLKNDQGASDVTLDIKGLALSGINAPLDGLIPSDGQLSFSLRSLPMLKLQELFDDVMSMAISAGPGATPESALKMKGRFNDIPKILSDYGASLGINRLDLRARDMMLSMNGSFAAQKEAPVWGAGKVVLALTGLDEFLDKAKSLSAANPGMIAATAGMIPFQLMGRYEKGAEGQMSKRIYALEVTPEGKMLMNGLDLALPLKKNVPGTSGNPTPIGKPLPPPPRPSPQSLAP